MQKVKSLENLLILLIITLLITSCKNGSIFNKKSDASSTTGWTYNDPKGSGFSVSREKEQKTGPGLVFVQGGTFTMGATDEDVMRDWNNVPKRVTVPSFYMDETEVANVHYREYLYWLDRVFQSDSNIMNKALPDTLCWREELAYNEPYVEYYFRHPSYNFYPVVGVTWQQAFDFCLWRSDRVNEKILWDKGIVNQKAELQKQMQGSGQDNFNSRAYLLGVYQATPGKNLKNYKDKITKQVPTNISFEEGIVLPEYRLPNEAEWEYAAYGYIFQNPQPRKNEKKRGEELQANRSIYPWSNKWNGVREDRHGGWHGQMLANFKRGSGDNMGVAGGLNDRASITAPVKTFYPNGFGLYNMAGNVSEWTADVYRPLSNLDLDDFNPYRGNKWKKIDLSTGQPEVDSVGRIKTVDVTDEESKERRNYQRGDVKNFLDGDSISQVTYGYGATTLVSDKSRVFKGGSWNDRAYWLSPGTRRFLEEDKASAQIGFRCAMIRVGSQEGNGFKTGNIWSRRKQNSRKR